MEVEDRGNKQVFYRGISTRAQGGSPSVSQEGQNPSAGTPEDMGHSLDLKTNVPCQNASPGAGLGGAETEGQSPRARTVDETNGTMDQTQWD